MMKRVWKTLLTAVVMSLAVCLCMGMAVSAEKTGGDIVDGFTWEFDTETETLTLTGDGEFPFIVNEYADGKYWAPYEQQIRHMVLDGVTSISSISNIYGSGLRLLETACGEWDGFSWSLDHQTKVLKVNGAGNIQNQPWDYFNNAADGLDADRTLSQVLLGDGITGFAMSNRQITQLTVGARYQETNFNMVIDSVIVSAENPFLSSYKSCVYTKDYNKLLYCPYGQTAPQLHPEVKVIGTSALSGGDYGIYKNNTRQIIIPWGTTTIEKDALTCSALTPSTIILPDTITNFDPDAILTGRSQTASVIYSQSNQIVHQTLNGMRDWLGVPIGKQIDSIAQYYPNVPEAQNPKPNDKPDGEKSKPESSAPSSQPTESKPESSEAQESSQPAESSKVEESSKPAESSTVESSAPTSSAPAENSESVPPSESTESSSQPESSEAPVSSAESSSEESIKESEPSGEESRVEEPDLKETGNSIGWIIGGCVALAGAAALLAAIMMRKGKK